MRVHKSMGHKHGVARGGQKQGCMREGRPRSWQRVPIRGRGVTRAEGDKQRQVGHKSRGSQASGHKRGGQDRRQGVTSRGRGFTRAEGHKQGVIRKAARIADKGSQAEAGGHNSRGYKQRVTNKGSREEVASKAACDPGLYHRPSISS